MGTGEKSNNQGYKKPIWIHREQYISALAIENGDSGRFEEFKYKCFYFIKYMKQKNTN